MKVIFSPSKIDDRNVLFIFLAGSIEMGKARNWQDEFTQKLTNSFLGFKIDKEVVILNPRRRDWDSSWIQEKTNEQFYVQVSWELSALEQANYIVYYFQAETMSPVSLLELGLHAKSGKAFVVCEKVFYRKGNVDIVCERYKIPQFESLEELADAIAQIISDKENKNELQ